LTDSVEEKEGRPDELVAFNRIKSEIEDIAKSQAEEITQSAKEQSKLILDAAKAEGEKIKQEILRKIENESRNTKIREISRKKLSLKMEYLAAREETIDELIVEAKTKLQKFSASKEYGTFLQKIAVESGISIGGGSFVLEMRKEDNTHFSGDALSKISKEIQEKTGVDTKITVSKKTLDILGGIRLIREDNKLLVDNTFETRMERTKEETRVKLLDLLN